MYIARNIVRPTGEVDTWDRYRATGAPEARIYPNSWEPELMGLLQRVDGIQSEIAPDKMTEGALYWRR